MEGSYYLLERLYPSKDGHDFWYTPHSNLKILGRAQAKELLMSSRKTQPEYQWRIVRVNQVKEVLDD